MSIDLSKKPYYDDYDPSKKYQKILFRPSRAVQTRELNQLQTLFQKQIQRFGDNVFKNASMVIPGETSYDLNFSYVKVNIQNYSNISNLMVSGLKLTGQTTGVVAHVVMFQKPENGDPSTFYLKYVSGGGTSTSTNQTFKNGETLTISDTNNNQITTAIANETGNGSKFTVATGVYYVNGRFIMVDTSTILLDKYDNKPSYSVGFNYEESIVDSNQDSSLLDNAQGTSNISAPGADRLKIELDLTKYALNSDGTLPSTTPDNYVEIFKIQNGEVKQKVTTSQYNILTDTLAQRTYDQSGDYTVNPFSIQVRESLNNGSNNGLYTKDQGGDDSKYVVQVSSGKAYVRGYEVSNYSTKSIQVDKARTTFIDKDSSISAPLGYYIEVTNPTIIPDISSYQEMSFLDKNNNVLGSGNVKAFANIDNEHYQMYLFDLKNTNNEPDSSFISNVTHIDAKDGSGFSASVDSSNRYLQSTTNNSLLFELPDSTVKTLLSDNNESNTSFETIRQFNTSVSSNGTVILTANSNETFVNQDPRFCFASFNDNSSQYIDTSSTGNLGGTPLGKTITFDFGTQNAGRQVRINTTTVKEQAVQKSKALSNDTVTISKSINGQFSLGKADAYSIDNVSDKNGNDITTYFTLVPNRQPNFYDISYMTSSESSITFPITVKFKYFQHGTGDYFSVDSYSGIDYEDIPVDENSGISLSDFIDFRPRIADDGNSFTGIGSVSGNIPLPYSIITSNVTYYVPRYDLLYAKSDGTFAVKEGISGINPKVPDVPENSMALYQMYIPAYTGDVSTIKSKKVSSERKTMSDLGKLEERISNLEYYVSLNMLEQNVQSMQITDSTTGLNRFKNGFLVDSFTDQSVADYGWTEYHASVGQSYLYPEFSLNAVDLQLDDTQILSGVTINDGIATLSYNEVPYIQQNMRTDYISVNPFAVYRWQGQVNLNPSQDSWIDTVNSQPNVIYEEYNNGSLTNQWNSWQVYWTSGSSSSSTTSQKTLAHDISDKRHHGVNYITGKKHQEAYLYLDTTTNTSVNTNVKTVNDSVVSMNIIPYMRSREVTITGKGNKPNTQMYFFFDGVDVSQYVKASENGSLGSSIVTDDEGNFSAIFVIPNNASIKFTVGTKPLVVTDSSSNDREEAMSYAEAYYTASGIEETRQKTIIATRNTETSSTSKKRIVSWYDPVAESFLIQDEGGVFLTGIDLFFQKKDQNLPVTVDIREMQNGQPTQNVVNGSTTTLNPSEVNTSNDGSVATKFSFKYPVYLQQDQEYCFVVSANSNEYYIFIATMGDIDLNTGRYVSEQPYVGVMFKSQNSSTWSVDQNSDIQFNLYKAKFNTGSYSLPLCNSDTGTVNLSENPIYVTNGQSNFRINVPKHNYVEGSWITLSNVQGGMGLSSDILNSSFIVSKVVDYNTIECQQNNNPVNATQTGQIGGTNVNITVTIQASLLNLNSNDITFPDTAISYSAKGTSGKSYSGTETPYNTLNGYITLENNHHYNLSQPWLIGSQVDEDHNTNQNSTLQVIANMTSNNENISPVIDLQRINVIAPYYLIDGNINDDKADGSNCYAKYRTTVAGLTNAANSLKVYVDVEENQGSEIVVSARVANSPTELENTASWFLLDRSIDSTSATNTYTENEFEKDDISDFTYYQIMIQMKSTNNATVPSLQKLRVIALGT